MSKRSEREVNCKYCNSKMKIEVYDSINVDINPELKNEVVSGKIYMFKCPSCGRVNFIPFPTLYHDMTNKYLITSDELLHVLSDESVMPEEAIRDFPEIVKEYKEYVVTSALDLSTKICLLDAGLDLNIAYATMWYAKEVVNRLDQYKDNPFTDVFIGEDKGKLRVAFRNKEDTISVPFPMDMYEQFKNTFKDIAPYIGDKYSSIVTGRRLFALKNINPNTVYEFLIVNTKDEIVLVDEYVMMYGQYRAGDEIYYMRDNKLFSGVVERVVHIGAYEVPFDDEGLPVALWKCDNRDLNGEDNIDFMPNESLIEHLKKNSSSNNICLLNEREILEGNCALAFNIKEYLIDDIRKLNHNIDDVNLSATIEYLNDVKDGKRYLKLYLDKKSLDEIKCDSYSVTTVSEFIEFYINNGAPYDGIIVVSDNYTHILSNDKLWLLKCERIMCYHNRMLELLDKLTKDDINELTEDYYRLIRHIYFDGKGPKEIALEANVEEKLVHKNISNAYSYLKEIIKCKY